MKKFFKNVFLAFLAMISMASVSSCSDELLSDDLQKPFDGEVSIDLDFQFEAMAPALDTRSLPGNFDFGIKNLTVIFYKYQDSDQVAPAYVKTFTRDQFSVYKQETRPDTHCEEMTYHGKVKIDGIVGDDYRVYAIANVDVADKTGKSLESVTEKDIREIRIDWPTDVQPDAGIGNDAATYGVPDAMFGYFTYDGVLDHTNKRYRNVVHHNTTSGLYTNTTQTEDVSKKSDANRAAKVTLDREHLEMQAWLKRVVSKMTIGYDGSALNNGVSIYIKSVAVKDAAASCFLGHDNSVGAYNDVDGSPVVLLDNDTYEKDGRFYMEYSATDGATGICLDRNHPAFPREDAASSQKTIDNGNDADKNGWDDTWYEYVHGSWELPNPTFQDKPTTLYFFENLQGVATDEPKLKSLPENDPAYSKDGRPDGTYIEVKAFYKNTNFGEEQEGNIVYRFMLGKDIKNDFNTERNHHYKLVLSFLGDANNPDWHIEIEKDPDPYFKIPDEAEWAQSSVWHAFNEDGEPIAEMVKELVYYSPQDPGFEYGFVPKYNNRYYFQVVTIYPVVKQGSEYITDLKNGRIAQVLHCDNSEIEGPKGDAVISEFLDKLGKKVDVKIAMHPRTEEVPDKKSRPGYSENVQTVKGYRSYYVIESLDWNWTASDAYGIKPAVETSDNQNNSNWIIWSEEEVKDSYDYVVLKTQEDGTVKMQLDDKATIELRRRPYKMKAATTEYPVVKIGASYWMRENFRDTKYLDSRYGFNNPHNSIFPYKTDDIYGYSHGGPALGYVDYDDKFPMYFDAGKYGMLYNAFALSGAIDPTCNDNNPKGYLDHTECDPYFKGVESNLFVLHYDDPSIMRLVEGWMIPLTYPVAYGDVTLPGIDSPKNDEDYYPFISADTMYLLEYLGNNGSRAMGNGSAASGQGALAWPSGSRIGVQPGMENLSGLTLLPIPANVITTDLSSGKKTSITGQPYGVKQLNPSPQFTLNFEASNQYTDENIYIPYWDANIATKNSDMSKSAGQRAYYMMPSKWLANYSAYPNCIEVLKPTGSLIDDYMKKTNMMYLPIRLTRFWYDYSVDRW